MPDDTPRDAAADPTPGVITRVRFLPTPVRLAPLLACAAYTVVEGVWPWRALQRWDLLMPSFPALAWGAAGAFALLPLGPRRSTAPRIALAALVVAATVLVRASDLPRRVAFEAVRSRFEAMLLATDSIDFDTYRTFDPPLQIGPYVVDACARDSRGGTYFRTASGIAFEIADTTSFGFAKHPNPEGCPFGAKWYVCEDLGGGWSTFVANNDYW